MDLCAFYVNGHRYGIPVLAVEEIVRPLPITPVPGSDRRLAGIINLRGVSATVVDLRRCLAPQENADSFASGHGGGPISIADLDAVQRIGVSDFNCRLILMEDHDHLCEAAREQEIGVFCEPVALLVDQVERVHRLRVSHRHPPPANLRHNFIAGIYELEDGFLSEISVLNLIDDILAAVRVGNEPGV